MNMEPETMTIGYRLDGTEWKVTINPVRLKWDGKKWKVLPYADHD